MFKPYLLTSTLATATLAAVLSLSGCGTPPTDLDYSLKHHSSTGRFVVEMVPPAQGPAVGQIHSWTLKLANTDGAPVTHARIAVDGGMPQHGHGLPTKPRVTRELASGTYLIEGMKFSMTGWWDLRLDIDADGARDKAVFNVVMAGDGLKRP
ncbi:MAG: Auxin-binding protein [Comamonadaceae bacterium]|jgi:hypothetical protein|nr:Auxin-binding protein [Comamonadaceae bacterium]